MVYPDLGYQAGIAVRVLGILDTYLVQVCINMYSAISKYMYKQVESKYIQNM